MFGTDRKNSPHTAPHLYRKAELSDITNAGVHGFYNEAGEYWRKNGQPQAYKRNIDNARVPVKFGLYSYDTVTKNNLPYLYVRLEEIAE
jgi:hypothetical protein